MESSEYGLHKEARKLVDPATSRSTMAMSKHPDPAHGNIQVVSGASIQTTSTSPQLPLSGPNNMKIARRPVGQPPNVQRLPPTSLSETTGFVPGQLRQEVRQLPLPQWPPTERFPIHPGATMPIQMDRPGEGTKPPQVPPKMPLSEAKKLRKAKSWPQETRSRSVDPPPIPITPGSTIPDPPSTQVPSTGQRSIQQPQQIQTTGPKDLGFLRTHVRSGKASQPAPTQGGTGVQPVSQSS